MMKNEEITKEEKNAKFLNFSSKSKIDDEHFLLSNISFKIFKNETVGFYFKNEEEKNAFKSFFIKNNKHNNNYSGFIFFEDDVYSKSFNPFSDVLNFYSLSIFDSLDPSRRIIEFIEQQITESQLKKVVEVIKKHNKLEKYEKLFRVYKMKNIEYAYIKAVNSYIQQSIDSIWRVLDKLKEAISENKKINSIYDAFISHHIRYLRDRINLAIEKNINSINLFFQDIKTIDYNKKLFSNIKNILKRFEDLPIIDKELLRMKKELNLFNKGKEIKNEDKDFDDLNDSKKSNFIYLFINEMHFKLNLYDEKLKKLSKNSDSYFTFFKRKIICKKFISLLKSNIHKFENLTKTQSINLFENLIKKYKLVVINQESAFGSEKKSIKKKLEKFVENECKYLINEYKNYSLENENKSKNNEATRSTKIIEEDEEDEIFKEEKIKKLINILKTDVTDLLEEIDWEKKTIFYTINENINSTLNLIKDEIKTYKNVKRIYNDLILKFLNLKNEYLANNLDQNKEYDESLSDSFFASESQKYETIYNFLNSDIMHIERMILKPFIQHHNKRSVEFQVIVRYMILEVSKKFKISIFDFLKRTGKLDVYTKSIFLLLISFFDTKKIVIFENLFYNLNENQVKSFSTIYNLVTKIREKYYLLIEKKLDKLKYVANYLHVVDQSKLIEHGEKNELLKNPIYETTFEAIGLSPSKNNSNISKRKTPEIFKDIVDFKYEYDNYKVRNKHFVYGDVEDIYDWTKILPDQFSETVSADNLIIFKNKIFFETKNAKSLKKNKKEKSESEAVNEIDTKEYLIIDVK